MGLILKVLKMNLVGGVICVIAMIGMHFLGKKSEDHLVTNVNEIVYFKSIDSVLVDFYNGNNIVVDVGCGIGKLLEFFHEEKGINTLYGIDLEEVIEKAKKVIHPDLIPFLRVGIGESIPFDSESVDILIFQRTFHHMEDFEQGMKEMARVLKPGGIVVILEPVKVSGRYELSELVYFYVQEEDRWEEAYNQIKEGNSSLGLEVLEFEKFLVTDIKAENFANYVKSVNLEHYEEGYPRMKEYVEKIAEEDNVKMDDIDFYSTSRINLWRKK